VVIDAVSVAVWVPRAESKPTFDVVPQAVSVGVAGWPVVGVGVGVRIGFDIWS
jgi:hypothetical protein